MSVDAEILKTLKNIESLLSGQLSEYCDTREALAIMGLTNSRDLKALSDMGVLPRYQRTPGSYKYKKSDCKKVAQALDNGTITIKRHKHENHYQLRTA